MIRCASALLPYAGAALGTQPDLDSIPIRLFTDQPVALMTLHRGFSHSLLVLPLLAWAIWAFCRHRGKRVAQAPARWAASRSRGCSSPTCTPTTSAWPAG